MTGLLIFDFDGVIADSEMLANQILAACVTELGVPTTLEDSYRHYMGKRFPDVIAAIAERYGRPVPAEFPQEYQRRTLDGFRTHLRPVPGALAFLDSVRDMPKCIASSSSPDRLALCLEVLGLTETFLGSVFSASMVEKGKPHPDIFLHAAQEMNVAADRAVIIEDSESGVAAGVASGATVIGLLAASHIQPDTGERLRHAGAHHVVSAFTDVSAILAELRR